MPLSKPFIGRSVLVACVLTAAGGSLDAWVYVDHGRVFANAQTGNIVLLAISAAAGQYGEAARHLPSLLAFCAGIVSSRLTAAWLKRRGANSRNFRLLAEAAALAGLAVSAPRMGDGVVTAAVGFLAAVQITSLSHIGPWSFNTGMTTGNLRGALSSASAAWLDPTAHGERHRAVALGLLCAAFLLGASAGAWATLRWGDPALLATAATVLAAALATKSIPDPIA